ncbi:cyclic nucleotide-binding domain-containing protein [Desulfobotulus mexicanus]|uniref:Cyclic nucleotide-binding domain-containing protein n=1 Tax=Desulfobotulus mexicanus TaxID=2586642 RepID=A0A5Q4VCX4_9BACT|nr:cyclic nucleotide-binding domain-containing protein [Desulfobotulus mexicanus]TYT74823.1 cyclic nucleotide-binding domain-containing protein [Desulfobotulus mexicanus]
MKEILKAKEIQLKSLLAAGRRAEAMDLLFELVVIFARMGQFERAEMLRQKMMALDSLAIQQIVAAAERIEQEKNKAIDKEHMALWKPWYTRLAPEERSAFFFATEPLLFSAGESLFRQGEKNRSLFFVDRGSLQLISVSDGGQETLIRRLAPGTFAGEDTFYKTSVCTTSLVALTAGACRVLKRKKLLPLAEKVPGLAPKLQDFCLEGRSSSAVLQSKGINRRMYKRIPAQGVIVFQVIPKESGQGSSPGLFKGRMSDISAGGLSFYVKTGNDKNVRQLLDAKLGMKFVLSASGNLQPMVCKGVVTGVLSHMDNEYSVHVKFSKPLDPMLFV